MLQETFSVRAIIATLALPLAGLVVLAQENADPKNVYDKGIRVVAGSQPTTAALKYDVLLRRKGVDEPVAASHRFETGDQFRLRFQTNRKSFVYVLHRTIDGDPERMERYTGAKGVRVVRDEVKGGRFQLLYPAQNTGKNNQLDGLKSKIVPENGVGFELDANPGIEKLVVVVSATPIDVGRMFRLTTDKSDSHRNSDSDESLDNQLKGAEENTYSSKGVCVGNCYAAPRASSKPMIVNLDLRHYSK